MKKILLLFTFVCLTTISNAQVKVNQNAANSSINTSSAFMDASSSSIWNASVNQGKGFLFPRVNLVNYTAMSHAGPFNASNNPNYFDGLLVFNTATGIAPIGGDSVYPGYYYYRNTTTSANSGHWISFKGLQGIAGELSAAFDDTQVLNYKTWTSFKINTEFGNKVDTSSLSTVAISGNYNDLSNKPIIPTQTSQLTNNSGFISSENQTLTINGSMLSISNGNSVTLPITNSSANFQVFTTTGLFTIPSGISQVIVEAWGGGGGGGGGGHGGSPTGDGKGGGGGSGGGYGKKYLAVNPGLSITITIGSGGQGGAGSIFFSYIAGDNGINGSSSYFGSSLVALGGVGGIGGGSCGACPNGTGGSSIDYSGVGSNGVNTPGGKGGFSTLKMGLGGNGGGYNSLGLNGELYGGGGGGGGGGAASTSGKKGGNGANGLLIVYW
jgi:hypothetical protein